MANFRITLEVGGVAEFDRVFSRAGAVISDLRPVWEEIKQEFFEIEQDQFQSSGTKGASGKWKELSPLTQARKIKKYGTFAVVAGPLIATERMYKSLTRQTDDTVFESDAQSMVIGTKVPYAKYHQRGGRNLPQREVISFSEAQKLKMQKRIQKEIVRQMRQSRVPMNETF